MFLREDPQTEIHGIGESHVLFANVADAEDARGMWIEVEQHKPPEESGVEQFSILYSVE
jgi:hypothetical protein